MTDTDSNENDIETWHVGYSAHGGLTVEATEEDLAAAVNDALGDVDTGDLDSPVLGYIQSKDSPTRLEQREARDDGVNY